jgi:hypothetical protein
MGAVLQYVNGGGYSEARIATRKATAKTAGEGKGKGESNLEHYTHALPARQDRSWNLNHNDLLECALTSDED